MKQVNVKKLILPNIPYVFIALLATKVSEAVRLAPGSDASAKLLNIMTGLNTAFHSLVPSFHPIDLCVGVAAAIAIRLAVYIAAQICVVHSVMTSFVYLGVSAYVEVKRQNRIEVGER